MFSLTVERQFPDCKVTLTDNPHRSESVLTVEHEGVTVKKVITAQDRDAYIPVYEVVCEARSMVATPSHWMAL
jgi:hypothetical protein